MPLARLLGGEAGMLLPIAVLAVAVVVIGVWPSLLQGLTAPAGQALIKAFEG